ncbi:MAG: laminin B domain-containing protein [Phycisphaeraceae bacterium]
MSSVVMIRAVAASLVLGWTGAVFAAPVSSYFDTDKEDWTTGGDFAAPSTWTNALGNPVGAIYATDDTQGGTWSFVAPAKFLGNQSGAYGGTFSYDLRITASDSTPWAWPMVSITGSGVTLNWNGAWPDANVWNHYDVPLNPAGGWIKASDSTTPNAAEFASVLSNLSSLLIRGEFMTGSDTGYLDNAVLTPEPASLMLASVGIGLGLLRSRRIRHA